MRKKKIIIQDFTQARIQNQNDVFLPSNNINYLDSNTNSWFQIQNTNNICNKEKSKINVPETIDYVRKYEFYPTKEQKNILNQWFEETTWIYNETLKYLKSQHYHQRSLPNKYENQWFDGTHQEYVETINNIKSDSKYKINSNKILSFFTIKQKLKYLKDNCKNTPSHILDKPIKQAVENYKSALSNYKNKNIKHFRIRYHRYNGNHTLDVEPCYVLKDNKITKLGKVLLKDSSTKQNFLISKEIITREFEIKYYSKTNKYCMIFPFKRDCVEQPTKDSFISLDPGVNPILTGVTSTNSYFFGKDDCYEIQRKLNKLDYYSTPDNKVKHRNKKIENLRRKLRNKIDDLHWKTIHYLTTNFNKILIGDLSVKSIVKKNCNKMMKRTLHQFQLYIFKERLQYKCKERGVEYREVNEYRTSKTCSCCGNIKENLGGNKIYECEKCKVVLQRDINGARNIYYASFV